MRELNDYIVLAVERQGLRSRNRLNLLLQTSSALVSQWDRGRAWPNEANMCKLADLAGIPRDEALLDLAIWRSDDVNARNTWKTLRDRLVTAAAVAVLAITCGTWKPAPAEASTYAVSSGLYIMESLRRLFARRAPLTA